MANSLEVRAPFLDTDFAEFAFNLPSEYKMRGSDAKWILKKAFARRLPPATLKKRKQGFAVPVAAWLKNELRPLLLEAFDRRKIAREGIFDPGRMEALVGAFLKDKDDTRKEIWALFIFEMWYDRWAV
jgi:asparagine synthase (glutamine-hydrolysing)